MPKKFFINLWNIISIENQISNLQKEILRKYEKSKIIQYKEIPLPNNEIIPSFDSTNTNQIDLSEWSLFDNPFRVNSDDMFDVFSTETF